MTDFGDDIAGGQIPVAYRACANCVLFNAGFPGQCRRRSPQTRVGRLDFRAGSTTPDESVWPPVMPDDWCGDFRPAPHLVEELQGLREAAE